MEGFFHGVQVNVSQQVVQPTPQADETVIGLVGTCIERPPPTMGYIKGEPFVVDSYAKKDLFKGGSIEDALRGIYDQIKAKVVVIEATDITEYKDKIEELRFVESKLGLRPTIILAPDPAKCGVPTWGDDAPSGTATTSSTAATSGVVTESASGDVSIIAVVGALKTEAEKLQAIAIVDTDGEHKKTWGSARMIACYPEVKVSYVIEREKPKPSTTPPATSSTGEKKEKFSSAAAADKKEAATTEPPVMERQTIVVTRPLSPRIAGIMARTDAERGYWHSPSNKDINGIIGLVAGIDFSPFDRACKANQLNEKKIMTVISNPYRSWGNSGQRKDHGEEHYRFISVLRTEDKIRALLTKALYFAIDRGITKNLVEEITVFLNNALAKMRAEGSIINGKAWADEELNTSDAIMSGQLHFVFEWTPVYIAEQIIIKQVLVNSYLKEVFS